MNELPGSGEGHPREPVDAGGGEEKERVPPVAPGVADLLAGVQDHKEPTLSGKVIAHGKARLAAADDHRLEPFWILVPGQVPSPYSQSCHSLDIPFPRQGPLWG